MFDEISVFDATTAFILFIDIILACFIGEILRRAGIEKCLKYKLKFAFALWLTTLYAGISSKFIFPEHMSNLTFFFILIGWVCAVCAFAIAIKPIRTALLSSPQELLLFPQGLRMFLGAGFIIQSSLSIMPTYFGIADGITHITSAFLAMKTAIFVAKGEKQRFELWFANLFGLLDIIVVAGGISFFLLDDISPYHNIMYAAFFAAPLFVVLHLFSIIKLLLPSTEYSIDKCKNSTS